MSALSVRFSVLSSQFSVLSSQFSVLSSQFSVLSSQFSVLSSQFSVLSSQFSVLSSQFSVLRGANPWRPGSSRTLLGSVPDFTENWELRTVFRLPHLTRTPAWGVMGALNWRYCLLQRMDHWIGGRTCPNLFAGFGGKMRDRILLNMR